MRFRWLTVPFVLTVVAGCRGAEPNHPQASVGAGVERDREVASPRSCIGRQRILEALGQKESTAASPVGREKYKTDPLSNALSPAESYRVGAPATVIIRTRDGLGSGVVVDKSGLVLTNHHVVDDFLQPDLTMRVSLELANIEPTGRMKRTGKTYQGDAAFTLNKSGEKVDRVEAKGAILQPERVGKSPKAIEAIKKAYARVADRKEEKEEK